MISAKLHFTPTLYIDDGHGMETAGKRTPSIPGTGVIKENEFNRPTADKLKIMAEAIGFRVVMVAPEIEDIPMTTRSKRINADFNKQKSENGSTPGEKLAVGVSIHFNAYNGRFDGRSGGVESYYYPGDENGRDLAEFVQAALMSGTEQVNRGVKSANFHMIREPDPVFILVECGFMDVLKEAELMRSGDFQFECAWEIMEGLCRYYGLEYSDFLYSPKTPILDTTLITMTQAREWAMQKGASDTFVALAQLFWVLAAAEGVNPAGAYAQAAHETGFGNFGGVIDASYHNTCGMKTGSGGGNYDPGAHQRFDNWTDGIRAHIQHLALYAGAAGYPKADPIDPRHFAWIKGKAPNFEDLGGKWAGSATYGDRIVKLMDQMAAVQDPQDSTIEFLKKENEDLKSKLQQINEISRG